MINTTFPSSSSVQETSGKSICNCNVTVNVMFIHLPFYEGAIICPEERIIDLWEIHQSNDRDHVHQQLIQSADRMVERSI